jgi:enterochelin esterase family protein
MKPETVFTRMAAPSLVVVALSSLVWAQQAAAPGSAGTAPQTPPATASPAQAGRGGGRGPAVVSPDVLADRRVVFRIAAPKAETVTLSASDIPAASLAPAPGVAPAAVSAPAGAAPAAPAATPATPQAGRGGPAFSKSESGVWEATIGPVPPGAFRYVFQVDGVRTLDPVNTKISESNTANWSLFYVPGLDVQDVRDVPHGAVASVYYASTVLKATRRLQVYTPPGYESGKQKYPVFYLLHGAGDSDDAWTSIGRAGFIMDNLIAAKQVAPMIVVMPAGHQPATPGAAAPATTAPASAAPATAPPAMPAINPFTVEFVTDVMPYVERHYRTLADRRHRAIAGLSMGGSQTLDIAFRHLARFAYVGVFSSGATLGGGRGAAAATTAPPRPDWEAVHRADLDNAALKKGTTLIWLSTGVDDGLIANTRTTVDLLKKHGFSPVFKESPGGHTWLNWRNYLNEFATQLFR